jgi:hypothetical protein
MKNKKVLWLDYDCPIGSTVQWENIKHERFTGKLWAIESNDESMVAIVEESKSGELIRITI